MTQVADTRSRSGGAPVVAPQSQSQSQSPSPRSSWRLWSIAWPTWQFDGLDCAPSSFAEAEPFIAEHYPTIFAHEPDRFLQESMTAAKRRFLDDCDVYIFRDGARVVGVFIGNPLDWSTYYGRTIAILPEYRERGIFGEFGVRFLACLRKAGLERLHVDTSPTNLPMNRGMLALGMVVTATVNCERWGVTLRYTKFLTEPSERAFRRQYISETNVSRRATSNTSNTE